jgi:DNA-binding MarR family transcriptional regulator
MDGTEAILPSREYRPGLTTHPVLGTIRRSLRNHLQIEALLATGAISAADDDNRATSSHRPPPFSSAQGRIEMAPSDDRKSRQLLSVAAAELYRMRRARDRAIPAQLVGEPGWDMLLALYSEQPADLCVSSLCHGSGVPQSTALRWITVLERQHLVQRVAHPRNERIVFLALTEHGRLTIEAALEAMLNAARD